MFTRSLHILAGVLTFLFICGPSSADLVLDLEYNSTHHAGGGKTLTVNSGDHVFVDLLITDTDASTPLTAEGLLSGGGRLLQTAGSIALSSFGITGNAGWDFVNNNPGSSGAGTEIAKVFGQADFLAATGVGQGQTSIVIATFDLIATGLGGSTAAISADILNAFVGNVTFGPDLITPGTDLDPLLVAPSNFGSVNLTLNGAAAVPEPTSILLGSLTAAAGGFAAWRRRRSNASSSSLKA